MLWNVFFWFKKKVWKTQWLLSTPRCPSHHRAPSSVSITARNRILRAVNNTAKTDKCEGAMMLWSFCTCKYISKKWKPYVAICFSICTLHIGSRWLRTVVKNLLILWLYFQFRVHWDNGRQLLIVYLHDVAWRMSVIILKKTYFLDVFQVWSVLHYLLLENFSGWSAWGINWLIKG